MNNNRIIARVALFLALTLLFQSLRMIIPLPALLSLFIVGTLVNACLLTASEIVGIKPALVIALIAPVIAYFQQLLVLPIFIFPVAVGNAVYITVFKFVSRKKKLTVFTIVIAAIAKTITLYMFFVTLLSSIKISPTIAKTIMAAMSWPQLITAILGGLIAINIIKRLKHLSIL